MVCKYDMIVELFTDYPEWENWIFQILANLDVFEGLENGEKTKLCFLLYSF